MKRSFRCVTTRALGTRNIHLANSIAEMRSTRKQMTGSVGFVPTMGALHPGHLSLVEQAMTENDDVVVSIFVNPTQFSPGEDLDKYPRTVEKDLSLLKTLDVKYVFLPTKDEMYKPRPLCGVEAPAFNTIHEGSKRPEFFRGVATIVCKLFNIVQPDIAYFGQKDISQFILLKNMVDDLNMPVQVKACPTLREADGLAMSSRNVYLSPTERPAAAVLHKALAAAGAVCASSTRPVLANDMIRAALDVLATEPLVSEVQYVSVASAQHAMQELSHVTLVEGAIISAAVKLGTVRLIDNIIIGGAADSIYR